MKTEEVDIESVSFDPANARKHGEKNLDAIKSSLRRFGQQKPIVVDANGVVRAGNGTLAAAKSLGWKKIAVVRSPLSGSEATAYAIADNRTAELAEWDEDILAQTLSALEEEDRELARSTGFDAEELDRITSGGDIETQYSTKVTSPVYEITGECPRIQELCDREKHDRLIEAIEKAELPEELSSFLRMAATRHIVFNYARIAEYYAHSEPNIQRLFEDSALVIIDFNRAVELGFVRLNEKIEALVDKDGENA